MISIRRAIVGLFTIGMVSACEDAPTAPYSRLDFTPQSIVTVDPTLVTFNSASCAMTNTSTGRVACSWDIGNPGSHVLNLWAEAFVTASYDCVNPKNGRIASSEARQLRTLHQSFGVSATSLTASNQQLPLVALINDYTGKMNKLNACKGNQVPQSVTWSLDYWDVSVITVAGTQRMSCFASDNTNGCLTL